MTNQPLSPDNPELQRLTGKQAEKFVGDGQFSIANQPEPSLRDYLRGKSFKIGFAAMGPDKGYLTDESIDELISLFRADKEAAVREAELHESQVASRIASRNDDPIRIRELLDERLQRHSSQLTHPQASEPVADTSQTMVPEFRDHGNEGKTNDK